VVFLIFAPVEQTTVIDDYNEYVEHTSKRSRMYQEENAYCYFYCDSGFGKYISINRDGPETYFRDGMKGGLEELHS